MLLPLDLPIVLHCLLSDLYFCCINLPKAYSFLSFKREFVRTLWSHPNLFCIMPKWSNICVCNAVCNTPCPHYFFSLSSCRDLAWQHWCLWSAFVTLSPIVYFYKVSAVEPSLFLSDPSVERHPTRPGILWNDHTAHNVCLRTISLFGTKVESVYQEVGSAWCSGYSVLAPFVAVALIRDVMPMKVGWRRKGRNIQIS